MASLRTTRNSLSRSYGDQSLLEFPNDENYVENDSILLSRTIKENSKRNLNDSNLENESTPKKKKKMGKKEPPKITSDVDVFCWRCHKAGDCIQCSTCPRVYHLRCAQVETKPAGFWPCIECDSIQRAEAVSARGLTVGILSELLLYTLERMKCYPGSEHFCTPVDTETYSNYKDYILKPMDISQLDFNIRSRQYGSTESFLSDAKWMVHNSYIFNSAQSYLTITARGLFKVAKQECEEIDNCHYCYRHAHTLPPERWFIEPCEKPHLLIWARLKGFPYWPAKVMKLTGQGVDVRFFGDHNRSVVPPATCLLYSKKRPFRSSGIRGGPNFERALEEIEIHILKLESKFKCFVYDEFRTELNPSMIDEYLAKMLPKCDISRIKNNRVWYQVCSTLSNEFNKGKITNNLPSSLKKENKIFLRLDQNKTILNTSNKSKDNKIVEEKIVSESAKEVECIESNYVADQTSKTVTHIEDNNKSVSDQKNKSEFRKIKRNNTVVHESKNDHVLVKEAKSLIDTNQKNNNDYLIKEVENNETIQCTVSESAFKKDQSSNDINQKSKSDSTTIEDIENICVTTDQSTLNDSVHEEDQSNKVSDQINNSDCILQKVTDQNAVSDSAIKEDNSKSFTDEKNNSVSIKEDPINKVPINLEGFFKVKQIIFRSSKGEQIINSKVIVKPDNVQEIAKELSSVEKTGKSMSTNYSKVTRQYVEGNDENKREKNKELATKKNLAKKKSVLSEDSKIKFVKNKSIILVRNKRGRINTRKKINVKISDIKSVKLPIDRSQRFNNYKTGLEPSENSNRKMKKSGKKNKSDKFYQHVNRHSIKKAFSKKSQKLECKTSKNKINESESNTSSPSKVTECKKNSSDNEEKTYSLSSISHTPKITLRKCYVNCGERINLDITCQKVESNTKFIDYNENIDDKLYPKLVKSFTDETIPIQLQDNFEKKLSCTINVRRLTDSKLVKVLGGQKFLKPEVKVNRLSEKEFYHYFIPYKVFIEEINSEVSSDDNDDDDNDGDTENRSDHLTSEEILNIIGVNTNKTHVNVVDELPYNLTDMDVQKSNDTTAKSSHNNFQPADHRITRTVDLVASTSSNPNRNQEPINVTSKTQKRLHLFQSRKEPASTSLSTSQSTRKNTRLRTSTVATEDITKTFQQETFHLIDQLDTLTKLDEAIHLVNKKFNSHLLKSLRNIEENYNSITSGIALENLTQKKKNQEIIEAKLKENMAKVEEEEVISKRQHWCSICLKKAKYHCCFYASYCSYICQEKHWLYHYKCCLQYNFNKEKVDTIVSENKHYENVVKKGSLLNPSFMSDLIECQEEKTPVYLLKEKDEDDNSYFSGINEIEINSAVIKGDESEEDKDNVIEVEDEDVKKGEKEKDDDSVILIEKEDNVVEIEDSEEEEEEEIEWNRVREVQEEGVEIINDSSSLIEDEPEVIETDEEVDESERSVELERENEVVRNEDSEINNGLIKGVVTENNLLLQEGRRRENREIVAVECKRNEGEGIDEEGQYESGREFLNLAQVEKEVYTDEVVIDRVRGLAKNVLFRKGVTDVRVTNEHMEPHGTAVDDNFRIPQNLEISPLNTSYQHPRLQAMVENKQMKEITKNSNVTTVQNPPNNVINVNNIKIIRYSPVKRKTSQDIIGTLKNKILQNKSSTPHLDSTCSTSSTLLWSNEKEQPCTLASYLANFKPDDQVNLIEPETSTKSNGMKSFINKDKPMRLTFHNENKTVNLNSNLKYSLNSKNSNVLYLRNEEPITNQSYTPVKENSNVIKKITPNVSVIRVNTPDKKCKRLLLPKHTNFFKLTEN